MCMANFKMMMAYRGEVSSLGQHGGPAASVRVSNLFTCVVTLKPQPGVKVSNHAAPVDGLQISIYW